MLGYICLASGFAPAADPPAARDLNGFPDALDPHAGGVEAARVESSFTASPGMPPRLRCCGHWLVVLDLRPGGPGKSRGEWRHARLRRNRAFTTLLTSAQLGSSSADIARYGRKLRELRKMRADEKGTAFPFDSIRCGVHASGHDRRLMLPR